MSVLPSMVHRSGDTLVVRSVVSGDPLYEDVLSSYTYATPTTGSSKLIFYREDHKQQQQQDRNDDEPPQPGKGINLPECKVKRNYSCSTCDYFTQNPRKFLYHLRDVHREKVKVYECPSCLYASKHYQKLLRHTRMVHGRNSSNATQDKSNLKTSTNATTTSHGRRKRGGGIGAVVIKEESIGTCDETMQTSPRPADDDEQDEEEEEDDDEHNHDIDDLQSSLQEGRSDSGSVKFRCALCSYVGKGQQQLTKHESEIHIRTKFFRCTKCSYVTHIKARYTKHVKYHSMPMIKCDLCDFRTPYKWNLDRHCKNHNGRGSFRCSACNFTADIKQSLTVHEMNHHVPPVGQAAMAAAAAAAVAAAAANTTTGPDGQGAVVIAPVSTMRRRNKVGASDSAYLDNQVDDYHHHKSKQRTKNLSDILTNYPAPTTTAAYTSADFVHPDDIVERPNGHIYLKSQCKLCNFKTAFDAEMVKHERTHHSMSSTTSSSVTFPSLHHSAHLPTSRPPRKTPRPVPNLIPIRSPPSMLSAKELHDITIGSSLKDYAPLFDSEELFQQQTLQPVDPNFKEKNASFFDKLKEKLLSHQDLNSTDLICLRCGHEGKCLTESVAHLKMCGKQVRDDNGTPPLLGINNNNTASVLSSTRCQYCRQRCKSSADLYVHMQTCSKYQQENELFGDEEDDEEPEHMEIEMRPEDILSVEEQQHDHDDDDQIVQQQQPHPMENRVFVWNDIEAPMNIDVDEMQQHHSQQQIDLSAYYKLLRQNLMGDEDDVDAVSLDLSIRTQSPSMSEATSSTAAAATTPSPLLHNNNKATKPTHTNQSNASMFGKVPTHGNDITIAQHKRVFKCPHCSFWASTASRFHVHIVGHLNKKPFECSLCAYRSNWRWDITKHIKLKSVRDPNHESARVLMTDETGRRNYTKYNKYLTEINMSSNGSGGGGGAAVATDATSVPSKSKQQQQHGVGLMDDAMVQSDGKPHSVNKRPPPDLKVAHNNNSDYITVAKFASVAALSAQSQTLCQSLSLVDGNSRKRSIGGGASGPAAPTSGYIGESRRPMYKCPKYTVKDSSQEKRLDPNVVKSQHYTPQSLITINNNNNNNNDDDSDTVDITCQPDMQQLLLPAVLPRATSGTISPTSDDSSDTMDMRLGGSPSQHGFSPEDSMTGSVDQRHCRLKHHGDISVIVGGRPGHPDRVELDRQPDEPEHLDMPQLGAHKCAHCPYSTDVDAELVTHAVGHMPSVDDTSATTTTADGSGIVSLKCPICGYSVAHLAEIYAHLPLHGVTDPVEYMQRASESDPSKRHKCTACPYVTNSKSQYMYHKRFHKPKNGQYMCSKCNYNVTKRHLLHQHMKVHSMGKSEFIDLEELDEQMSNCGPQDIPLLLTDQLSPSPSPSSIATNCGTIGNSVAVTVDTIPLIWVSRGGNFSKMYKCRHCPHVNTRKVNIQEHEKMHLGCSANGNSASLADGGKLEGEHHCSQCDYVCNNAGVLSSHIKVHQGAFGILHCLVDPQKSDDEQIRTLTLSLHQLPKYQQAHHPLTAATILPPLASASDSAATNSALHLDPSSSAHVDDDEVPDPPTDVNLAASLAESGDMLYFCHECPARFLKFKEFDIHGKLHGGKLFYKCQYCSYTGRQRPHLNAHAMVHTTEYKKRTSNLRAIYRTHPVYTPPVVTIAFPDADCWVVAKSPTTAAAGGGGGGASDITAAASATDVDNVELDSDTDINDNNIHGMNATDRTVLTDSSVRATRTSIPASKDQGIPLSGTDLFRHRQMAVDAAENQMKLAISKRLVGEGDDGEGMGTVTVDQPNDEHGTFGMGNPDFIYPMCTKNGRQKEKRYKCAKCPTAFEKRDQYKIHLGLHGSKQRFQCDECDYSVAYSSNFVQHQRKHVVHKAAIAAAAATRTSTAPTTTATTTATSVAPSDHTDQTKPTSVATVVSATGSQQQLFRCPNCPYSSRRRDAVDNHLKRHASVSGVRQAHVCDHCDYSVAQAHILRDHVKMHFAQVHAHPDAFISPDVAVKVKDDVTARVIFDDRNDSGDAVKVVVRSDSDRIDENDDNGTKDTNNSETATE